MEQSGQLTLEPAEPLPLAEPPQPADAEEAEPPPGDVSAAADSAPAAGRADILQARRRMLCMMVALTAGAAGLAITGIAAFWVIIPPALLLAGFLVLLRAASRSDAERVGLATRIDRTATSPMAGEVPEPYSDDADASPYQVPVTALAPTEPEAAPDAEVIDISGRVSDQVYDQYADAAERAVGD
jgi:hypothetical protein